MTIYCEGALKAEVTFSLTGGREGKIISDRPPVNVVFPAIGNLIQIKTNYFGGGGLDRILYEDSTDASDDANWESLETVIFSMFLLNNSSLEFPSLNYAVFPVESGFLFRTALFLNTNGSLTSLWDNNYKSGDYIRSYTVKVSKKKKVFLIEDTDSVLYAHEYPEGFSVNYSVNCIGCGGGECAGGDGKGGVICMDCEKVKRDLNAIKGYLK